MLGVDDGLAGFRILAQDGRSPVAEVAHRLKSANLTVEALTVERGRLDDVFRVLTAERPETGAGGGPGHG